MTDVICSLGTPARPPSSWRLHDGQRRAGLALGECFADAQDGFQLVFFSAASTFLLMKASVSPQ